MKIKTELHTGSIALRPILIGKLYMITLLIHSQQRGVMVNQT